MTQPDRRLPVRPIDVFHDEMMARAEAEHEARTTADRAAASKTRAAVLLEAADHLDALPLSGVEAGVRAALTAELRRLAGEAQQGEAGARRCVCGESEAPNTVHRADGPCYVGDGTPVGEARQDPTQDGERSGQPDTDEARCVCGDPIQLQDDSDPTSWIHSPGSDTPCLNARPSA